MSALARRPWVPDHSERRVQQLATRTAAAPVPAALARLEALAAANRRIHDEECLNLNPATNVMSPRAEALLAAGLGSRPSLGYPGDKYETGLEAIEESRWSRPSWWPRSSGPATPRCGSPRARSPTSTPSWPPASPGTRSSPRPRRSAGTSPTTGPGRRGCTACGRSPRRWTRAATRSTWRRCAGWPARCGPG